MLLLGASLNSVHQILGRTLFVDPIYLLVEELLGLLHGFLELMF